MEICVFAFFFFFMLLMLQPSFLFICSNLSETAGSAESPGKTAAPPAVFSPAGLL